jgi:Fe2+ or Zn2+ uptake regulation protein
MGRNTKQKQELNKIVECMHTFFDADELHAKVESAGISKATVYRFLQENVKDGQLYTYLCDRRNIYSKDKTTHCHFICEKTGTIKHFKLDSLDFLKDKIPGKITSVSIEVKGICEDCK